MPQTSTILVVDDMPAMHQLIATLLGKYGYHLEFASNGAEALSKAEALSPDLVLLDIMMPDMDGYEVCRRLRAAPRLAEIPIIMVTAKGAEIDTVVGLEVGADDYVTKPYRMRELVARMRAVMRRQGAGGSADGPELSEGTISVGEVSLDPDEHRVLIDGTRAGEVDGEMIRDRRHLAADGLVVPVVVMNRQKGVREGLPEIVARGFVPEADAGDVLADGATFIAGVIDDCSAGERSDEGLLKERIRGEFRRFLKRRTGRRPMVLPVVMEI